ncbi:NACHT domain-containing protein [Streptomyces sp. NPDC059917]|uniref:NACHT domain-containing protein n=1 Tax=Streptomyces sp. NPDC059917 TaxID=3347002 RepID=UPI0036600DD2
MSIEAAIAGRLAGAVASPLIGRVQRELARRGRARGNLADALARIADPDRRTVSPTALLNDLPRGVNNREVLACIATPEFRALSQQLMAIEILDGDLRAATKVKFALRDFFRQQFPNADVAAVNNYSELLFVHLHRTCEGLVGELRAALKDETNAIDWAHATLARATADSIESYLAVLARPHRLTIDDRVEWTQRYRKAFSLHEEIALPDLGNRRRIHYSKIFVKPQLSEGQAADRTSFDDFVDSIDRTVLLGDPGAGKSTSSAVSASLLFQQGRSIPFYVVMREVDFTAVGFSLVKVVEEQLSHRYQIRVPEGLVEELLLEGSALLVFDGLDEVQSESVRRRSSEIIETASRLYPLSRILATSRIVGYGSARLNPATFHEYRIRPFDDGLVLEDGEVRAYVSKWFSAGARLPEPADHVADTFMRESASIPDLRCNPLLLAYICVLYRGHRFIPRSRAQLYKKCAELLLADWDNFQGLPVDSETDLDTVRHTLAALAYRSITDPQWLAGMPESDVRSVASAAMSDESVPAHEAARRLAEELVNLCRGRAWIFTELGTEPDGSGIFGFTHQSLQEYFAALHLTRNSGTPELLADRLLPELTGGRWEVLTQICMNLADEKWVSGSSRVVTRLLERGQMAEGVGLRTLVEFMARWLDVVKMNVTAMRLLMKLAVDSYIATASGELRELLSPAGPYPAAAWAAFQDVAEENLPQEAEAAAGHGFSLAWLVANVHYLPALPSERRRASTYADPVRAHFDSLSGLRRVAMRQMQNSAAGWALCLYTGAADIRVLASAQSRRAAGPPDAAHTNVLSVMLDTAGTPNSLGPLSPAAWIFDTMGGGDTDTCRYERAHQALVDLAVMLGDPMDTLVNLDIPRLDDRFVTYWNECGAVRCERVLRQLYEEQSGLGRGAEGRALTGLVYVCTGLVELLDEVYTRPVRYPLSLALLAKARREHDAGILEPVTRHLMFPARRFVANWSGGRSTWNADNTQVS